MRAGEQRRQHGGRARPSAPIGTAPAPARTAGRVSAQISAHCSRAAPAATPTKASHTITKPCRTSTRRQRTARPCTISSTRTDAPIGDRPSRSASSPMHEHDRRRHGGRAEQRPEEHAGQRRPPVATPPGREGRAGRRSASNSSMAVHRRRKGCARWAASSCRHRRRAGPDARRLVHQRADAGAHHRFRSATSRAGASGGRIPSGRSRRCAPPPAGPAAGERLHLRHVVGRVVHHADRQARTGRHWPRRSSPLARPRPACCPRARTSAAAGHCWCRPAWRGPRLPSSVTGMRLLMSVISSTRALRMPHLGHPADQARVRPARSAPWSSSAFGPVDLAAPRAHTPRRHPPRRGP